MRKNLTVLTGITSKCSFKSKERYERFICTIAQILKNQPANYFSQVVLVIKMADQIKTVIKLVDIANALDGDGDEIQNKLAVLCKNDDDRQDLK